MYGWRDAALDFIVGLAVLVAFFAAAWALFAYADEITSVLKLAFSFGFIAGAAWVVGALLMRNIFKIKPFGAAKTKEESK